jgi:hypothetical protein
VVVVTTPANPFVPKGMQPGETRTYTQQVSVNYLDDPSDQRYSGSINGTYTYVGTYQVTVPAGTFPAVLFRVKCEGKVGPAHTVNTGYNFFCTRHRNGRDDPGGGRDRFLAIQHRQHNRQGPDVEMKFSGAANQRR